MSSNSRVVRLIRRPMWNSFYSIASRRTPDGELGFMNLGYLEVVEVVDGVDGENSGDMGELVSAQLYDRVVRDVKLEGRSVVEVGCGCGAGSTYLAKAYHPASILGVDINKDLIRLGVEHQQMTTLRFQQGDAQSLPIAASSVDVVVNIESSHCYPSRLRFFEEVVRILRPGGSFAFADIFVLGSGSERPADVRALLERVGLTIQDSVDITLNVLAARDAVWRSPAFRARMQRIPPRMLPIAQGALFLPGAASYSWLASGRVQYWQWRAAKSVSVEPSDHSTDTGWSATADLL
jgi:SAM-dependent methyltransferase